MLPVIDFHFHIGHQVADRVIFGSDWPGMLYIKRNIELIRGLSLEEETKERILGGNAARILGISD